MVMVFLLWLEVVGRKLVIEPVPGVGHLAEMVFVRLGQKPASELAQAEELAVGPVVQLVVVEAAVAQKLCLVLVREAVPDL